MKICIQCKQEKTDDKFYLRKLNKDKLSGQCKECIRENQLYVAKLKRRQKK